MSVTVKRFSAEEHGQKAEVIKDKHGLSMSVRLEKNGNCVYFRVDEKVLELIQESIHQYTDFNGGLKVIAPRLLK